MFRITCVRFGAVPHWLCPQCCLQIIYDLMSSLLFLIRQCEQSLPLGKEGRTFLQFQIGCILTLSQSVPLALHYN